MRVHREVIVPIIERRIIRFFLYDMPIYLVADLPRDVPALLPLHSVALLSRNLNKMIILRDLKSHGIPNVSHGFLRIVVYLFAAALISLKKSIMN